MTEATIQELNLELMRRATFNQYDGEAVVKSLLDHKELWQAVIMDGDGYWHLAKLRDLLRNYWNVDTVYILAVPNRTKELRALAETWKADEIRWMSQREAANVLGEWPTKSRILRLWWD